MSDIIHSRDLLDELKTLDKIQVTNKYFEYLLKLPKITPTKKFNDTTLRMSIIEIA